MLRNEGPKWGYYPEPSKSVLVVKPGNEEAKQIFRDLHGNVVASHGFLGGFLGTSEGKRKFVKENIRK